MVSFLSLLAITNVVVPDPNIFLSIASSLADTAAVKPNAINTCLANGLITFPIKDNPFFIKSPNSLPKNPIILFFDNFILADEPFVKSLQSFACYLLES